MFLTLLYFILALFLLITVHEYGHFLVARWCGVRVLRFSLGFGYVLARFRGKTGTEYALSVIPFGGYVKMLDENEGPVSEQARSFAFNRQPRWKQCAIVMAGPLFNFIFAFFLFWLVLVIGIQSLAPIVDKVIPGGLAAKAGIEAQEEIVSLNGHHIASWRDVQYAMMPLIGSTEPVRLGLKSLRTQRIQTRLLPLDGWHLDEQHPDLAMSLGMVPFLPFVPPIIGQIVPASPASTSGFQLGDRVLSVDGQLVHDWIDLVMYVKDHPNHRIAVRVKRNGHSTIVSAQTGVHVNKGIREGFLGMIAKPVDWPTDWLRTQRENPFSALATAFQQTAALTSASFVLIGRLFTGKLALQTISGPVGIAEGAGASGRSGVAYYLSFLAMISISLGVLNLLPIPMLDGGHLFYYLLEFIGRRPVSVRLQSVGMYLGMLFLVTLTLVALRNDLTRLLS